MWKSIYTHIEQYFMHYQIYICLKTLKYFQLRAHAVSWRHGGELSLFCWWLLFIIPNTKMCFDKASETPALSQEGQDVYCDQFANHIVVAKYQEAATFCDKVIILKQAVVSWISSAQNFVITNPWLLFRNDVQCCDVSRDQNLTRKKQSLKTVGETREVILKQLIRIDQRGWSNNNWCRSAGKWSDSIDNCKFW